MEIMVKDSKDSTYMLADVGSLPASSKKTHSQFVFSNTSFIIT